MTANNGKPAIGIMNTEEIGKYLYHPGYEYDHDGFLQDVENEDTEGYEDDIWGIMSRLEKGKETAEIVDSIDLNRPGIYIKNLGKRTYAYVFDGEIVWEHDA